MIEADAWEYTHTHTQKWWYCSFTCPQQLNQHIQHELREKDLIIMDHNKLNSMLQRRLFSVSFPSLCCIHNILWNSILRFPCAIQGILINFISNYFYYCTVCISRNGFPTLHPWSASTATTVFWCSKLNSCFQYVYVTGLTTDNWFPGYLFGSSDLCESWNHNYFRHL